MLSGCYRKDEATDPEIYSAAIAAIFDEYDDEIVVLATDPRTGLPTKYQWLPTVKEVRDFCEEIVQARGREAQRKRDLEQQMKDRDAYEAEQAAKRNRTPEEQAGVEAQIADAKRRFAPEPSPRAASTAEHNADLMVREYRAAGLEPVYASTGKMISLALARQLAEKGGRPLRRAGASEDAA